MNNHNLRRSGRHGTASASAGASGSEYLASEKSVEMQREPTPEPPVEFTKSRSGRRVAKMTYVESSDSEVAHPEELIDEEHEDRPRQRNSRPTRARGAPPEDDEEEPPIGRRLRRSTRPSASMAEFIVVDEEEKMHTQDRYFTRNRSKKAAPQTNGSSKPLNKKPQQSHGVRRLTRRSALQEEDFFPEPQTSSGASADADGSLDDAPHTSSDIEPEPEPELEHEPEPEEEVDGRPYALRQRQKINYAIPPPLEDMPKPSKSNAGRSGGRAGGYHGGGHGRAGAKGRTLGWSASGAELGRWMGMPGDDSVTIFIVPFHA
jgi:ATPase family AAA domain-containing protein 2